jgi:hypothetical protein
MKKFSEYLKEQGIELVSWQEQAAVDFLKNVEQNQGMASGKTFLLQVLFDFVQTHGNCFELDISSQRECDSSAPLSKIRPTLSVMATTLNRK